MKFLNKLLSENNEVSCMRFMALISLLVGSGIAFYSLYMRYSLNDSSTVVGIFVGAAFGGKVWQKSIENKPYKVMESKDGN